MLLCLICIPNSLQAQEQNSPPEGSDTWKAGIARVVITPQEYMWMAGYAARTKPAEGKLHDLWAKALALEDARGNRVLLITTDLIGFDRTLSLSICKQLEKHYQLKRKDIILSSTHTHSGPVMNSNLSLAYPPFDENQKKQIMNNRSFVEDQIISVAGRAINSLAPVEVTTGTGIARFAVNRRENKGNEEILYESDLNGPSDHKVQVIRVTDQSDRPMAVVFGYSCHSTCLSGYEWSGDYPGFAQIELETEYPGLTSMFFLGFGADQNPVPRGSVLQAIQYGKELAIAVERVMEDSMSVLTPFIHTVYNELDLELADPPRMEELEIILEGDVDWQKRWAELMQVKLEAGEEFPASYPYYPVQTWQLGEQTLVVLGGEVVVDYAFALRDTLGNDLMIMAYANDIMSYIPTERVLQEGEYEGETSMWVYGHHGAWEPGIEKEIIDEVIRQVGLIRE